MEEAGTGGDDGGGETSVVGLRGTDDTAGPGGDRDNSDTGSTDGGSGNRKDKETEGAGVVVEEGEA